MTVPENNRDKAALALRQKLQDEFEGLKGFVVPWRGESRHQFAEDISKVGSRRYVMVRTNFLTHCGRYSHYIINTTTLLFVSDTRLLNASTCISVIVYH